ncbi:hypothetical protein [Fusibacter ferrireducens]|uniref:Uncharacterized protein n=1 Tax=Fusibacter ferrireducens TaxID=2785058 RepID=A0ABR9ZWW9_9FIRM|nr:hypothetical protein [Fusibacter ferrireducens]MBF4694957.1 hypothetical protein [Fusibacter ferrireducens]
MKKIAYGSLIIIALLFIIFRNYEFYETIDSYLYVLVIILNLALLVYHKKS